VSGLTLVLVLTTPTAARANATPVCRSASVSVESGKAVTIRPACTDADGDKLYPALAAGSEVAHGRLSNTPALDGWVYTSDPGYAGTDGFEYVVIDRPPPGPFGQENVSNVAAVSITVTAPPPPVVVDGDGDGVPDRSDDCPKVPGSEDYDGCPPDQDGDGVPDIADQCPTEDARTEGRHGCPAPWLPTLHTAAVRAAHAIDAALRNSRRRAAFKRDLRLAITVKLPRGLPRHRFFSLSVLAIDIPWSADTGGRARCRPGHRCRVVIHTTRDQLRAFHDGKAKKLRCAASMFKPGQFTDSELARVRLPGLVRSTS
jgi:hypothetical protein